jgi:hypothetical protein
MSYLHQDQDYHESIRVRAIAAFTQHKAEGPIVIEADIRWTRERCEEVMDQHGIAALRTFGVPLDYSGMRQLRDAVPYNAKKLESLTRKYCSSSPEFAPRSKSVARFASQDTRQRFPTGGPSRTRQSPPQPFESGPNTLPGMEEHARANANYKGGNPNG